MDDRQTSPRKLILIAAVIAVPSLTAALILLTNLVSAPADARYADGAFSGDLLASTVEIIRDSYGVPHIYGPSDASVVFGAAYAQAEDNWWQVEDNFIRSLGRASELYGEETLLDDYLARALEIPRRSIEEYERAPEHMKTLYDAYAEGFNFFLQAHPEVERRLLTRVEPWHTLALIRFKYHHNEYIGYAGLRRSGTELLLERPDYGPAGEPPTGSNEMAISGSRTASGYPMLLINPHVAFFGLSQYNEVHLESEEGLIFSGLSRYGFMLPYMGHSDFLGWAYTDNYSDIGDVYLERFDDPDNPLQYRYGDDWREAETWPETIRVLTEAGVEERVFDMKKTHHGPVLGVVRDRDGADREAAIRLSKLDEGGWFEQWYGMMRARSHEEWYEAVASLNVPYMNTMYADRDGNIHYLYNAAVPRRSTELDWSEPLNGADTTAEWEGYHSLDELPQVLNPETGYLQNTNSTPLMATEGLTLTRSDFPAYLLGGEGDNHRAQRARQILASLESVTLEEFARAVLDGRAGHTDAGRGRAVAGADVRVRTAGCDRHEAAGSTRCRYCRADWLGRRSYCRIGACHALRVVGRVVLRSQPRAPGGGRGAPGLPGVCSGRSRARLGHLAGAVGRNQSVAETGRERPGAVQRRPGESPHSRSSRLPGLPVHVHGATRRWRAPALRRSRQLVRQSRGVRTRDLGALHPHVWAERAPRLAALL
jgi:acyl-homoserine lactone acylase PvdQ